ncbi:MAG TPA: zinc-dependent metalloprotease [Acidimicrobiia bacterium]|nr:zinc-dependent metalloprotease [Acidimicrobiia bacterium]
MSDVPQMPGVPNPFGFDLTELMRMLQSPGPVNMEVARQTAEAMAGLDLDTGTAKPEPSIADTDRAAIADVVRAAQLAVADATGISEVLSVSTRCVTRAEWAKTTLDGLARVLDALGTALGRRVDGEALEQDAGADPMMNAAMLNMIMETLVPLLLGGWAGSMIGLLAHRALGQYDLPLPLDVAPEELFVVHNVDDFAREWELPTDELRYALALRESVHTAQRAVPWVRTRVVELAAEYVGAYEVQPDMLRDELGNIDLSDPSSMQGLEGLADPATLLGAMQSERQAPMLEELQRFLSVLEGYTDIVVASVGARMVGAHGRVDEALRRHRLERGDATGFLDRLLGLQLERAHYEIGASFCRGVLERADLEQLNRLWTNAEMFPTRAELEAPGLWLARINL